MNIVRPKRVRTERHFPLEELMAIDPSAVRDWLGDASGGAMMMVLMSDGPEPSFTRDGKVAVVTISGPLLKQASFFDGYDAIRQRFAAALSDPETDSVMLRFDSPGGVVSGLFEAARAMRQMRETSSKPVFAFADDVAFSAAYLLASTADRIYLGEAGQVGSVGILTLLADRTAQNQMLGLRVEIVASGKRKADGHPDAPITPEQMKRAQGLVDDLAAKFAAQIALERGLSAPAILALEAATFMGEQAVAARLADGVMTFEEALRLLESEVVPAPAPPAPPASPATGAKMKTVLLALGLPEASTEAEAMAALGLLKDQSRQIAEKVRASEERLARLEAAVGKTGEEAIGHVVALKSTADEHNKLTQKLALLETEMAQKEHAALIARGTSAGQLTPAMVEWAKASTPKSLEAFLAAAPRVIPLSDAKEPAPDGAPGLAGKKWEDMKPMEKHALYHENRALYDALKAEAGQRAA